MAYSVPRPLHVKWNRLFNSLMMISAVFLEQIDLLYLFLGLNLLTLAATIHYGPTRWMLRPFEPVAERWIGVPPALARSYAMTAETERFEILLRLAAGAGAAALYPCCPLLTWLMVVCMGIFMLISAFFGFCLSALGFIAICFVKGQCRVR